MVKRIVAFLVFILMVWHNLMLLSTNPGVFLAPTPTPNPPGAFVGPPHGYVVRFHPDVALYTGDLVSVQVIGPAETSLRNNSIRITFNDPRKTSTGQVKFTPNGFSGQYTADAQFAWDTHDLAPGSYEVTFSIFPNGITWEQSVDLLPAAERPADEMNAHWATAQIQCCIFYYITGTQAEHDLSSLEKIADDDAASVSEEFNAKFKDPVQIVWVPRVLGQGALAGNEIYISYLPDNYAGGNTAQVLHHEMVHILDNQLGGEFRPTMLVEGLAVYLSGGHFKPEPLLSRAATLLDLGWYMPLSSIADQFYLSQHEIGYLESAALIDYMVRIWGWDAFNAFYRDIHPDPSGSQAKAIDTALRKHFGLTFNELDDHLVNYLSDQPIIPDLREDVELTVTYYDTVRLYQQDLDPSAYFREFWVVPVKDMESKNVVADYLRHPDLPVNQQLEKQLVDTDQAVRLGDFTTAWKEIYSVKGQLVSRLNLPHEFN